MKRKLDGISACASVRPTKRRASSESSNLLTRRNHSPMYIKTEPRSASVPPPEISPLTAVIPHSEVDAYEAMMAQEENAAAAPAPAPAPAPVAKSTPQAPQHERPVEPQNELDNIKDQILAAFAQNGVPTDLASGELGARIADAVAGSFASVVHFAERVNAYTSGQVARLQADNADLRGALAACDGERARLGADFARFQRRATQRGLEANLRKVEAKVDKLRAPVVSLDEVRAAVAGFQSRLQRHDATVDALRDGCAGELKKLGDARKALSRDARHGRDARRRDVLDLGGEVQRIDERVDERLQEAADLHDGLCRRVGALEGELASARDGVDVLRRHVEALADDGEQQRLNTALSSGLAQLREKQFEEQLKLEARMQDAERRMGDKVAALCNDIASAKGQFRASFLKAYGAFK